MAEYVPVAPGEEYTLTASATITGGQLVVVSGSNTVAPAGLNSGAVVGAALHDAASGQRVVVAVGWFVHEGTASGAIAAGADVIAGAAGTVAQRNSGSNRVGVALTAAADGAPVRWLATNTPGSAKAMTATAGTPGSFTPAGSYTPYALADLTGVTASPSSAWTTGQRVVLGNGTNAYWTGAAWAAGSAP